ncbi:MAG: secondary thiamine-phosphate synthase enzyme YjbQ [Mariprofundaceae bacterium]|nr:secondary thiamine-phosphate synthase enzyme YjbQ [Mariprofundaceae bacterium]
MKQLQTTLILQPKGRGFINMTAEIQAWLADCHVNMGQLTVFVQHTSCSLIIQENAEPDVLTDMETFMSGLVKDGDSRFLHQDEGKDDMPAHIRTTLTQTSLTIPVIHGQAALGMWQAVYLYEHRYAAMQRKVILHVLGE